METLSKRRRDWWRTWCWPSCSLGISFRLQAKDCQVSFLYSQIVSQSVSWSVEWSCRYLFSVFPSHLFWPYLTNILSFWQRTHGPASLPLFLVLSRKLLKCGQVKNLHTQPKRPKKGKPSIYVYRKCQCKSPPYLATSLGHKTAAVMRHSDFLCFLER